MRGVLPLSPLLRGHIIPHFHSMSSKKNCEIIGVETVMFPYFTCRELVYMGAINIHLATIAVIK